MGTIARSPERASLNLLSAFELNWDGDSVLLPAPAQRLLAFVALRDRPVLRSYVAETLRSNRHSMRAGVCALRCGVCGATAMSWWR